MRRMGTTDLTYISLVPVSTSLAVRAAQPFLHVSAFYPSEPFADLTAFLGRSERSMGRHSEDRRLSGLVPEVSLAARAGSLGATSLQTPYRFQGRTFVTKDDGLFSDLCWCLSRENCPIWLQYKYIQSVFKDLDKCTANEISEATCNCFPPEM